jgi:hypothetical protein
VTRRLLAVIVALVLVVVLALFFQRRAKSLDSPSKVPATVHVSTPQDSAPDVAAAAA